MGLITDNNGIWVGAEAHTDTYPQSGYDDCFDIEKNSFWFLHRNEVILQVMANFPFSGNIADIGGGNGFQANAIEKRFPGKNVYLVEPGYSGCMNAVSRGLKNVYNVMFEEFPFYEKDISAVCLFDVVEHIEDDYGFLNRLKQSVAPGTLVFITVPAYNWLWSDVDDFGHHFRRYNSKSIRQLAMKCGFEVLYNGYFFFYLVPLTYTLRHIPYKLGFRRSSEKIIAAEHQQHKAEGMVNKVFDYFNNREINIFRQNKRLSYGASCIAVFRIK